MNNFFRCIINLDFIASCQFFNQTLVFYIFRKRREIQQIKQVFAFTKWLRLFKIVKQSVINFRRIILNTL